MKFHYKYQSSSLDWGHQFHDVTINENLPISYKATTFPEFQSIIWEVDIVIYAGKSLLFRKPTGNITIFNKEHPDRNYVYMTGQCERLPGLTWPWPFQTI